MLDTGLHTEPINAYRPPSLDCVKAVVEFFRTMHSGVHIDERTLMSSDHRNDISTESSPGAEDNDNLGAEDGKGTPATVPPNDREGEDSGAVEAENPDKS